MWHIEAITGETQHQTRPASSLIEEWEMLAQIQEKFNQNVSKTFSKYNLYWFHLNLIIAQRNSIHFRYCRVALIVYSLSAQLHLARIKKKESVSERFLPYTFGPVI